jgi:uncharacterized protein YlzI (FlbEa/FlbD family)
MWIFRKDGKAFNLNRTNMLRWDGDTTGIMFGGNWWVISMNNVVDKIMEAYRRGDRYVEVE